MAPLAQALRDLLDLVAAAAGSALLAEAAGTLLILLVASRGLKRALRWSTMPAPRSSSLSNEFLDAIAELRAGQPEAKPGPRSRPSGLAERTG